MISPHHLELFFHVARNAGISRAARNMPYGIQQPAISKQIRQLELQLGLPLFVRQPFALTPVGRFIYERSQEFFDFTQRLPELIQPFLRPIVRIATSEFISSHYLPIVLQRFRHEQPAVQVKLFNVPTSERIALLGRGQIDLAISAFERVPDGYCSYTVVELPLVLLVPKAVPRLSLDQCWIDPRSPRTFVSPPSDEEVTRRFLAGLHQRGVVPGLPMEVGSTAMVTSMVATGEGIGVSLDLPQLARHPGVRAVPLPGFGPVEIAVMWREPVTPWVQAMIHQITRRTRELWPV